MADFKQPDEPKVLAYTGAALWALPGIPARDLTAAEAEAGGGVDVLVATGIYAKIDEKGNRIDDTPKSSKSSSKKALDTPDTPPLSPADVPATAPAAPDATTPDAPATETTEPATPADATTPAA